ncbi:MAG TPA: glycosyltransferase family 4 protein [Chitinophagaceae bacterium]|nr:glycosyltransferase family 4 protein [Chitinophagaceae bacterium]
MKILFVCLHLPDKAPGQRFRFEQYLGYLAEQGIEYRFSSLLLEKDYPYFYKKGYFFKKLRILARGFVKRFREIKKAGDYDIIFIQRESFMLGTSWFERQYAKKTKLIYDYDDAIWLDLISGANKVYRFLKNPDKTKEIIKVSGLVIAGNQYLADYAKQFNPNVVIIPTTIDTEEYKPAYKLNKNKICIGWSGSFSTIAHFKTCIEALGIIKNKYGSKVYFKVIGDENYINKELGIQGMAWKKDKEVEDLQEIDIGIMPLPDDEWTKGKCGLKGLQYMALAIPTIMSPVGVNTEIIEDGVNGFLASGTNEWVNKLSRLIESEQLRCQLGAAGRKTVEDKYSVKSQQQVYLEFFKKLSVH